MGKEIRKEGTREGRDDWGRIAPEKLSYYRTVLALQGEV